MVSIQATSAPPSRRPSICSTKISTASSSLNGPSGARRSPVGPTEPATTTRRPALSATLRAISAARRLSSRVRASSLCSIRRRWFAPKLLVRMMSEPASTKAWWRLAIRSGCSAFQSSGESPEVRPMANRLVPVAPSASSGRPSARRDCSMEMRSRGAGGVLAALFSPTAATRKPPYLYSQSRPTPALEPPLASTPA